MKAKSFDMITPDLIVKKIIAELAVRETSDSFISKKGGNEKLFLFCISKANKFVDSGEDVTITPTEISWNKNWLNSFIKNGFITFESYRKIRDVLEVKSELLMKEFKYSSYDDFAQSVSNNQEFINRAKEILEGKFVITDEPVLDRMAMFHLACNEFITALHKEVLSDDSLNFMAVMNNKKNKAHINNLCSNKHNVEDIFNIVVRKIITIENIIRFNMDLNPLFLQRINYTNSLLGDKDES